MMIAAAITVFILFVLIPPPRLGHAGAGHHAPVAGLAVDSLADEGDDGHHHHNGNHAEDDVDDAPEVGSHPVLPVSGPRSRHQELEDGGQEAGDDLQHHQAAHLGLDRVGDVLAGAGDQERAVGEGSQQKQQGQDAQDQPVDGPELGQDGGDAALGVSGEVMGRRRSSQGKGLAVVELDLQGISSCARRRCGSRYLALGSDGQCARPFLYLRSCT